MRQRLQNVPQNIGLVRNPLQVRILLPVVIGNGISLEELRILHQQLDRLVASLRRFQRRAQ